jgi:hypothetical protein
MASLQQQLDLHIQNAAISGPEKQLRIREVRRYLDEIKAEVVSLPIATVAAVSGDTDADLNPLSIKPVPIAIVAAVSGDTGAALGPPSIRPVPIATVIAVSGGSDATLDQISTRPIPMAIVAAVSGIPLPF